MLIFELATLFYNYVFMIDGELPQTFCIFAAALELFGYIVQTMQVFLDFFILD